MKRFWLIIPLALCMFAGCTGTVSEQPQTNSFFAMDTVMDLTIYGNKSLLADVETLISDLEEKVSVTDETSELYTINQTRHPAYHGNFVFADSAGTIHCPSSCSRRVPSFQSPRT